MGQAFPPANSCGLISIILQVPRKRLPHNLYQRGFRGCRRGKQECWKAPWRGKDWSESGWRAEARRRLKSAPQGFRECWKAPGRGKDWNESDGWCTVRQCVEMSLDAAGRSACATSGPEGLGWVPGVWSHRSAYGRLPVSQTRLRHPGSSVPSWSSPRLPSAAPRLRDSALSFGFPRLTSSRVPSKETPSGRRTRQ